METTIALMLLVSLVGMGFAQDLEAAPVIAPVPLPSPRPPFCLADVALKADTSADIEDAEPAEIESLTWLPPAPVRKCEDGPVRKLVGGSNVFYWPPIYRGSCDNLYCKDPPCIARRKVWRYRCVLVYRFIRGCWRKLGFRNIRYEDHLTCGCKTCNDIKDQKWCMKTSPCPNGDRKDSFCYWRSFFPIGKRQVESAELSIALPRPIPVPISRCTCCTPFKCRRPRVFNNATCSCVCPTITCPPGRIFNPWTCECDCPPGSKLIDGNCVGDCSDVSLGYCTDVKCQDNKHFNCQVVDKKCTCPSCDNAQDAPWCRMTNCLEQSTRPMCVWDSYKCRCPRCEDQTEYEWCVDTKCGYNNQLTCRFDYQWNSCSCPSY